MYRSTALGLGLAVFLTGAALAAPEEVRFERDDGAVLVGTFHAAGGEKRPAVLLLHQAGSDRHELEAHARKMYEQAEEPRRIEILAGSSAHGASMLAESAELRRVVLEWLESQLGG